MCVIAIVSCCVFCQCTGPDCQAADRAGWSAGGYEWSAIKGSDEWIALHKDGRCIGAWSAVFGTYRPYVSSIGDYGDACTPPIRPPTLGADKDGRYPTGVIDPFKSRHPGYRVNGKLVSEQAAMTMLAKDVPDDHKHLRVSVIGPDTATRPVLADLATAPALAPWKDRIVVQAYTPDNWAVARVGFKTDGNPTIYVQTPTGKVLHRQDSYAGAEALAGALRKADEKYQPANDPNLGPGLLGGAHLPLLILGGAALLILLWKPKETK